MRIAASSGIIWFSCLLFLLLTSHVSAVDAGLTTPGTPDYLNVTDPFRVTAGDLNGGRDRMKSVLIDPAKGYLYIGTGDPGDGARLYKAKVGAGDALVTRVATLDLQSSDRPFLSAIDTFNGYAYVITDGVPGKIIKVSLGEGDNAPKRLAELSLNPGEAATSCSIDTTSGHLFIGVAGSPGSVVKVALGTGDSAPVRLGSTTLSGTESPNAAVIDSIGRYAYFGSNDGNVVQVSLNDGGNNPVRVGAINISAGTTFKSAQIDPINHCLYFPTYTNPGLLIKLTITPGTGVPVLQSTKDVINDFGSSSGAFFSSSAIDSSGGYIYLTSELGTFSGGSFIQKIKLNGASDPTFLSSYGGGHPTLNVPRVSDFVKACAIDPVSGYGFFVGQQFNGFLPGELTKLRLGVGDNPLAPAPGGAGELSLGKVSFNQLHDFPIGLTLVPSQSLLYTVCATGRAFPVGISLGIGNDPPVDFKSTELGFGGNPSAHAIDAVNQRQFFVVTFSGNKKLITCFLNTPQLVLTDSLSSLSLPSQTWTVNVVDPANKCGYLGSSGGDILRFNYSASPYTLSNTVSLGAGDITSAVLDTAAGYGYFGTSTGKVVKVALSPTGDPTVNSTVDAASGYSLTTAVIDPVAGYAYFGGSTTPGSAGVVVRIKLGAGAAAASLDGTAMLNSDESVLNCSVVDLQRRGVYIGTGSSPGKVVVVSLGDSTTGPSRATAVTLQPGENNLSGAELDPVSGYVYFACNTSPGRIAKLSTGSIGRLRASAIVVPDNASVSAMHFYSHAATGKVRLSIYNNESPKKLIWQSGLVTNTVANGTVDVNISAGTPSVLNLTPGTYWLAWETDTIVASYAPGAPGDGFYFPQSFGAPFPQTLSGETSSSDRWTQYITYSKRPNFRITGPAVWQAGQSQAITVTALDKSGNPQTDYTGSHSLVFAGAGSSPEPVTDPTAAGTKFGQPTSINFASGSATVNVIFTKAESPTISVSEPALNATTTQPLSVTVNPGAANHFKLTGPSAVNAGAAGSLTIAARDAFGNVQTSFPAAQNLFFTGAMPSLFNNQPQVLSTAGVTGGGNFSSTSSIPVTFTSGVATLDFQLFNAETALLAVRNASIQQNATLPINVSPLGLDNFSLIGNGTQEAGTTQLVTVLARDQYGNTAKALNASVNATFSGASSSAFGTPTANGQNFGSAQPVLFTSGVASVPIVLVSVETAAIQVVAGAATTPSPLSVVVSVGAPFSLTATTGNNQTTAIGTAFGTTLSATVRDRFNNPIPGATVTFSVPGSGASGTFAGGMASINASTNSSGVATATALTANSTIGVYSATATIAALSDSFTLANANDAPSFNLATPTLNINEDAGQQTVNITGITSGAAAHALAFTASSSDSTLIADASILVTDNGDGTGTLKFTPAADLSGSAVITVSLKDSGGTANGGSDTSLPRTLTVNIAPVNDPPTLDVPASATVMEDSGPSTISLTGISAGPFENQSLTFTYTSSNTAIIASQTTPQTITGTSALLSFTPLANAFTPVGTPVTLTITVADNGTPTASFQRTTTVTVLPVNDAPVATNQTPSIQQDNPLSITLAGTDVENDTLTFAVVSTPQHGTLSGTAPALMYQPDAGYVGPDSFTFRANDGNLNSAPATVSISVTANPAPPTVTSLSLNAGTVTMSPFTITVNGTNFTPTAQVLWNGQPLATTFGTPSQVTASVTAAELANAGRIPVGVRNPVPQFAVSNTIDFYLYSGAIGTWIVTNTNDSGQGSLRLALASARNADNIVFDPQKFDLVNSDAETLINVFSELPALDDGNVTIDASSQRVSINGSAALSANGLVISSDGNAVKGLTILGFARSGISIRAGAKNNVIGGDRNVAGGPNGEGLRISGNGTFGIEITDAGTNGNTVKGCWVGLDAGGSAAQPNLAGIIIQNGAQSNVIGSTVDGERNVISGNALEGITVAGAGTDNNVVIGNIVGASGNGTVAGRAVDDDPIGGRSSVGNGSSGVFLRRARRPPVREARLRARATPSPSAAEQVSRSEHWLPAAIAPTTIVSRGTREAASSCSMAATTISSRRRSRTSKT